MPRNRWQRGRLTGIEGVDFVACRICGDRRRVISGRHLSKHGTDRASYMNEYKLSPDELVAKAFRIIQSCQPGFKPNTKAEWVDATERNFARLLRLRGNAECREQSAYSKVDDGYADY